MHFEQLGFYPIDVNVWGQERTFKLLGILISMVFMSPCAYTRSLEVRVEVLEVSTNQTDRTFHHTGRTVLPVPRPKKTPPRPRTMDRNGLVRLLDSPSYDSSDLNR